ncbi:heterokaryon incompatibility protein-domain-containing protein [Cladorrhinum sp. PSN259]|nr:heterokaryon incompatibility protein-domain-containing protein [Cladorrhinum sp. PSN259]
MRTMRVPCLPKTIFGRVRVTFDDIGTLSDWERYWSDYAKDYEATTSTIPIDTKGAHSGENLDKHEREIDKVEATFLTAEESRLKLSTTYFQVIGYGKQGARFTLPLELPSGLVLAPLVRNRDMGELLSRDEEFLQSTENGSGTIAPSHGAEESETDALRPIKVSPTAQRQHGSLYSTLDGPGDQFRLLEILPADQVKDPLRCRLHVCALGENIGAYEALSYTWLLKKKYTSEFVTPIIECDGVQMTIGMNLFLALQRLRRTDKPRVIWADGLCINQGDLAERSQQVSVMGEIYQNAFQVIHFEGVCSVVSSWAEFTGTVLRDKPRFNIRGVGEGTSPPRVLTSESDTWFDILKLYKRKWFLRLWVIQEIALARRATAMWGECEMPWEWIGLAAAIIRTNWNRIVPKGPFYDPKGYYDQNGRQPTDSRRQVPPGVMNAYFMYRISRLQRFFQPLRFSLCELLALTRQFQCQDKRDKIFGLLGLPTTDQVKLSIKPDYAKSLDDVYRDIAYTMIVTNPTSLAFLSFVQNGIESGTAQASIPSWIPKWAADGPQTLAPLDSHPAFAAGLAQPADFHLAGPERLAVRGIFPYNEVVVGINSPGRTFGLGVLHLSELLQFARYSRRDLEELAMTLIAGKGWYGTPMENRQSALADFADALLGDKLLWALQREVSGTRYIPNDYRDGAEKSPEKKRKRKNPAAGTTNDHRDIPIDGDDDDDDDDYNADNLILTEKDLKDLAKGGNRNLAVDAVSTACDGRRLFTTSMGKNGVGPVSMRRGDQVCIIYGTPTPFIVRKLGTGPGQELEYELVGECYIDSFMHGEALENVMASSGCWIILGGRSVQR